MFMGFDLEKVFLVSNLRLADVDSRYQKYSLLMYTVSASVLQAHEGPNDLVPRSITST